MSEIASSTSPAESTTDIIALATELDTYPACPTCGQLFNSAAAHYNPNLELFIEALKMAISTFEKPSRESHS